MKLTIPKDPQHSAFRLTARVVGGWSMSTQFDNSTAVFELAIPTDVDESQVEVFIEPLLGNGQVDAKARKTVLKTAVRPRRGKPNGRNERNNRGEQTSPRSDVSGDR